MRHIRRLGVAFGILVALGVIATPPAAAALAGAVPRLPPAASPAPFHRVNGQMMGGGEGVSGGYKGYQPRGGWGGGGFGGGDAAAVGGLIGGMLGGMMATAPVYQPPPPGYVPPPAYTPPPADYVPPPAQYTPPPSYAAAPSSPPPAATPQSDATPPAPGPSPVVQTALQAADAFAAAAATLETTATATPPADADPPAGYYTPLAPTDSVAIDAGNQVREIAQRLDRGLSLFHETPTEKAMDENILRVKWGMQPQPAAPRPSAKSVVNDLQNDFGF